MSSGSSETNGSMPPYRRIAAELRAEMDSGALAAGDQIPTQEALSRRFKVSRATVQRALDDLRQDDYIDSQRGRGSYVQGAGVRTGPRQRPGPGPAGVELAEHLDAAFQEPRITVDSFSLTAETLNSAIQGPLRRIQAGEIAPESIAIRLLVPEPAARLAVPRLVNDPEDGRPLERLRQLAQNQVGGLQSSFHRLADLGLVVDASIEIRTVSVTPFHKLYLINGSETLFGYYKIVEHPVSYRGVDMEIYDTLGLGATLFHYSSAGDTPDPYSAEYVRQSQDWFDSVWSTIAEPLRL
ncbi:GntR family transcriptional regulator [Streptomyces sp. RKAG337]|uniref:GntR family transcriptional regulator n=1 Tax=Streptomyces sp. RKAG337 TaxID=2893404 RepID=UPI002034A1A4|nr:GntR family transcriptional regulator [Streptomyces sp. RKAG337]MCM2427049.1 GntR family transcriptional regulator [Streptomyces sp. RKAG337]